MPLVLQHTQNVAVKSAGFLRQPAEGDNPRVARWAKAEGARGVGVGSLSWPPLPRPLPAWSGQVPRLAGWPEPLGARRLWAAGRPRRQQAGAHSVPLCNAAYGKLCGGKQVWQDRARYIAIALNLVAGAVRNQQRSVPHRANGLGVCF